ncbi:uncharacterized protein FFNC_08394 [Fusarium fujikuroi]|nr:uncharacterized protein FFE2_07553 [Fusarium fujikuroi]SCO42216.1 uncharacterized protein FFNC_08394 [Fusarium fujikuroi]SCV32474.1 uncharacterized protein FFFS_03312 [Fusarium fujikuroi]
MFQHYCKSKEYIQRAHLEAELPGSLLQDALAVANFPSKNPRLHIKKWSKGQLPNPFLHHDSVTIDRLDRIYTQLAGYIEDYITKATSIYPPRAYMCIPSPCSNVDQLQFRGQPTGIDILRVDTLTALERNSLFRAFFRYELVSKIQYVEDSTELDHIDELVAPTFRNFSHGEAEAFRCVLYYMRDLYGAVFAHYVDSRLPGIPAETPAETGKFVPHDGLRFPKNICFSSDTFLKEAFAEKPIPKKLELFGFNLMTRLLNVPRDDRGCPIRLMAEMPMRLKQEDRFQSLLIYDLFQEAYGFLPISDRHWDEWSKIGQALRDNGSIAFAYGLHGISLSSGLQRKIYRQRAWAFFDHAGYYPKGNVSRHFPTLRQLESMGKILGVSF